MGPKRKRQSKFSQIAKSRKVKITSTPKDSQIEHETESSCDVLAFSRDAGARDARPKSAAMISELVESEDEESDESDECEDIDKSPPVKVNL